MENELPNLNEVENKEFDSTIKSLRDSYAALESLSKGIQALFLTAAHSITTISETRDETKDSNSIFVGVKLREQSHPWHNVAAEIDVTLYNLKYYRPTGSVLSATISVQNNGDVVFRPNHESIGSTKENPIESLKIGRNAMSVMISIAEYATSPTNYPVDMLDKIREFKPLHQEISKLEKKAEEWRKVSSMRHAAKLREDFMTAFDKPTNKILDNLLSRKETHIPVIMGSPSDAHMQFIIERFTIHSFTDAAGRKHYSLSDMNHRRKDLSKANLKERLKKELLVIDSKVVQDIKEIFPFYENFFSPDGYAYLKMIEVAKAIKSRNNLHSA